MATVQEQLIQHDNVEEIREALRAQKASTAAIKPNEEFSING
jgi:hypothetical protein